MAPGNRIRVAVNGYGVIGKRVADAVALQPDMELAGVCDVVNDWRARMALTKGYPLYAATAEHSAAMRGAGLAIDGTLDELLARVDVVVDCTPKRIAAANVETYRRRGIRFIVQGGEKHSVTGHSFVAEVSYAGALGRNSTRVVSCNTTSIVRTLSALKRAGLLRRARGTLLRRATDPWESHLGGIMNTLAPEPEIPSHQGPDAQSVDPGLDVVTMAVKVPETLAHLHYWAVQMTRPASKDEVLAAFRTSSRIALIRMSDGLEALNAVKEMMADMGRPHDNLYEVALWEDMLTVQGDELFYAYMVDNQAIVIPETIDAIRALTGLAKEAAASVTITDRTLGIGALGHRPK
ncbi:type II glyceraldehyde-3-phosphate dehydrogenase [Tabrizicola sp.]|jgi:glyceraldehyde-3-phosphate dehydrogenase (NAD(P))|uniref:type II glyceraldehyde-3-phosphate dehydrogenase n=1 Tax=Tabrizicola sp. TaxID=2005166 RepID=UPI000BD0A619|nr:type II glyceraldehyde-3-phosphate dehydrogenase [Tabrizicola sp.]MBY0349559.1 type II glyceraldehyde-3-phosphate dehydrogenase [Tabrizicola sp.]OYX20690.1 MAG: type II glyceraldehyde-3-phosphate dehydrogenase [Rhodobacterales bacterium 32-66-9]